jgi:hypothetical protein
MGITRVHYRERQRLVAADLLAEQDYRLAMGGRHHLAAHDWGVVRGLRVLAQADGSWLLTPGVAIDGYGRELFVAQSVSIAADTSGGGDRYVVLNYCEDPGQRDPRSACTATPAQRIRSRVAIATVSEFFPPDGTIEDLDSARAAGVRIDVSSWPVLAAVLHGDTPSRSSPPNPDYSQTPYAAHRAAMLRAPTGRAQLQLGLTSAKDAYQALLSTDDGNGGLAPRLAVDHDATVHVWPALAVFATVAEGTAELGAEVALHVAAHTLGGFGRRLRVSGVYDWANDSLSASLLDLGNSLSAECSAQRLQIKEAQQTVILAFGHLGKVRFALRDLRSASALSYAVAKRRLAGHLSRITTPLIARVSHEPPVPPTAFEIALAPNGASLSLEALDAEAAATPANCCDDVARTRPGSGPAGTPALSFLPAAGIVPDAAQREASAVVTSKPTDPLLVTELHFNGGAEDDSDTTSRLAIVSSGSGDPVRALSVDGSGQVRISSGDDSVPLTVSGSVHLAAIGKNDPVIPDMLALAYMSGLGQMGRAELSLLHSPTVGVITPNPAVPGQDYRYSVAVPTYATGDLKRCFELIIADDSGETSFRSLDDIVAAGGQAAGQTFPEKIPNYRPSATNLTLFVVLLMYQGSAARVMVSNGLPISFA